MFTDMGVQPVPQEYGEMNPDMPYFSESTPRALHDQPHCGDKQEKRLQWRRWGRAGNVRHDLLNHGGGGKDLGVALDTTHTT